MTRRLCLVFMVLAACGGKKKPTQVDLRRDGKSAAKPTPALPGAGLRFHLSEGAATGATRLPPAPARPLDDASADALLARLPALETEPADVQEFAMRAKSLPPPRTGDTLQEVFPPKVGPEPPDQGDPGELSVVRFAPEGEVPLAPNLSVTFSQPMIAVSSHAVAEKTLPVRLTPEVPGKWRWVGTRTLLFEPAERFPQATKFKAEVALGTASVTGGKLAKAFSFEFATPPPVVTGQPNGVTDRQPIITLSFNQKVSPEKVLPTVKLTGGGNVALRLATAAELDADKAIGPMLRAIKGNPDVHPDHWVFLRPISQLPTDTGVDVQVGPGTPSLEGPRVTDEPYHFSFRTYSPLEIVRTSCEEKYPCPPRGGFWFELNNQLDHKSIKHGDLGAEPKLGGKLVQVRGSYVYVMGESKGQTTYHLTLPASLQDIYGQKLGKAETRDFHVGSAPPSLRAVTGTGMVVLDPVSKPSFLIRSVNHDEVRLRLFAVGPELWRSYGEYQEAMARYSDDDEKKGKPLPEPPGRRISDSRVKLAAKPDEEVETKLDLAPGLQGGVGQLLVVIEDVKPIQHRWERVRIESWVQATQIGLDAVIDGSQLHGWANSLRDGASLPDVELEIKPSGVHGRTGVGGVAALDLPGEARKGPELLVARKGHDVAILPAQQYSGFYEGYTQWIRRAAGHTLRWFTFDDRHLYKPGEEVHLKGWVRRIDESKTGDLEPLGSSVAATLDYTVTEPRGNVITKGTMPVSATGGFDTSFKLPDNANLGTAIINIRSGKTEGTGHVIEIQEFRRPEFDTSASTDGGPYIVTGSGTASVHAAYYAGGALPGAEVTWRVTASPASFAPPNHDGFTFGKFQPWWSWRGGMGGGRSYGRARRYDEEWEGGDFGYGGPQAQSTQTFAGHTDVHGDHHVRIDFDGMDEPKAWSLTASATVMDVNRQAWTSTTSMLVHPAREYVGLESDRAFVAEGDPLRIDAIVSDLDGKLVAGRKLAVRAVRVAYELEDNEWHEKEVNEQKCDKSSAAAPVRCEFATKVGGEYRVRAEITDPDGHRNQSELDLSVAGGETPPPRELAQETVKLTPDKREYQPGDHAEVLVNAPFANAEGLLTVRRGDVLSAERFTIKGHTHTLVIPITEAELPGISLQVDLVGSAPRTDDHGKIDDKLPRRPAYAVGGLELSIPPRTRTLTVEVQPRERNLDPGAETPLSVLVTGADGKPVANAEVAVVAVNESILALSGYAIPDPIGYFYNDRWSNTQDRHSRESVILVKPEADEFAKNEEQEDDTPETGAGFGFGANGTGPGGGGAGQGTIGIGNMGVMGGARDHAEARAAGGAAPAPKAAMATMYADKAADVSVAQRPVTTPTAPAKPTGPAIQMRKDLSALALWAPSVTTGADGRVTLSLKLPDNLTRYRVTAVAIEGDKRFGKGEATVTARLPLMVRPSAPRFLNFGDKFELPVVVENQTSAPLEVDVAVRATNATLTAGRGRLVTVPANDRVEVRFPAAAAQAGTARFQVGVSAGERSDAQQVALPVWTPATTEAFATYGSVNQAKTAVVQPVEMPPGVFPEYGGLEVETSSTQLQALTDAVLYLVAYRFECSEQLSSRILAVAALRDVLKAFHARGLPSAAEIEAAVVRDVERLRGMQNGDGGFGFWQRGDDSWPYLTVHVTHALVRAKEKGFAVPAPMLARALQYLRDIERHYPDYYDEETRHVITSYALYVRARAGDVNGAAARVLTAGKALDALPIEAVGWLLPVMAKDPAGADEVLRMRRLIVNHTTEEAGTAHFAVAYQEGAHLLLSSDRRADGILLESLIDAGGPEGADLVPKIVKGLLAHRTRGRWGNTQENAFVLLALDRYFHVYEKDTPNYVARVWLGQQFAAEHAFRGRTTERDRVNIPMAELAKQPGQEPLTIGKDGPGRLYYRIGMSYAPRDFTMPPSEHGFTVERTYEAVDDAKDVRRDPDGTWHVKLGAKVRVRLTMVARARRYHVALVDPLPAGFEALNPALRGTEAVAEDATPAARHGSGGGLGGRYSPWDSWRWRSTWWEHQNLRDERVEAFTSLLWEGVYGYTYVARATTPGSYLAPPTKAEEMYEPETFGRSASDRVVVE